MAAALHDHTTRSSIYDSRRNQRGHRKRMAPPPGLPAAAGAVADAAWRSSLTACDSRCGPAAARPLRPACSSAWGPSIASARAPWVGRSYGSATVTGRMVRGRFGTSSALFSSPAPDLSDGIGGGAAKVAPAAQGMHQRFLCLRLRRHPQHCRCQVHSNACRVPAADLPPAILRTSAGQCAA